MAPKRPRVEGVRSVLEEPSQPRKRRRSEDEEEEESLEVRSAPANGRAEAFDVSDDSDIFSEVESDAEMEEAEDIDRNIQGAVGTLKTVVVKNFMCHAHLKVEFSGRINFLTGPNGSGKSAVLVAIVIGLGASTAFTGRGKKLESVVMSGKNSCTISVTIANKGVDAYKHSQYGDSITVERIIRVGGNSTWKVMDHKKKEVAKTKAEVNQITEHFNLQVNNPCAILMQDTSRQYLSESTPQAKYKFFMVGTQLQKIEEDYFFIHDQNEIIKRMVAKKQKHLPIMEKAVEKAKEEHDRLSKLRDIEAKINLLKDTLAWTLVKEEEDKLADLNDAEDSFDEQIKKANTRLKKIESGLEEVQKDITVTEEEASSLSTKISDVTRAKGQLDREASAVKRQAMDIRNQRKEALTEQEDYNRRRGRILKEIEKLKVASSQSGAAQEELRLQEEKKAAEQRLQDVRREQEELSSRAEEKGRELNAAKSAAAEVRAQAHAVRSKVDKCKHHIEQIRRQKQNRQLVFGNKTPEIADIIRSNANRFQKPPVGPIGSFLELKDPAWALAVEEAISRKIMCAYIVDNHTDERLFKDLLRRRNIYVPWLVVTKQPREAYRLEERVLPPRELLSVMQILEVRDAWVFNVLVDQTGFHSKLLFPDRKSAEHVIYGGNSRSTSSYLKDGSRVFMTNGSKNFVPVGKGTRGPSMLNFDGERSLAGGAEELQHAVDEQQALEAQAQAAQEKVRGVEREFKSLTASRRNLDNKESAIERQISKIDSRLSTREDPPDIAEMEANAAEFAEKSEELGEQASKLEEGIEAANKELQAKIQLQEEKTEEMKELETLGDEIEQRLAASAAKQNKLNLLVHNSNQKLTKLNDGLKTLQENRVKMEEKIELAITNIHKSNVRSREEVGALTKSAEVLDKKISKHEAILKAHREVEGRKTVDEALRDALRLKERFRDTRKALKAMADFSEQTDCLLEQRIADWRKCRKMTANQIRRLFMAFLSKKGHTGTADFDHKAQTLKLSVQLEKLSTKSMHQSTNSLSGGERSYTTVSLLMSLWSSMMTPFTAMDEFDVFMDQVTRKKSVDTLLEFARHYHQQQFIFITPQSLTGDMGPDVKVTRMYPPER